MEAKTIWMTGLSGAGKTTLANALILKLREIDRIGILLDGDILRNGLCRDLAFDVKDRAENIRRTAEVARLLNLSGIDAICALISPLESHRRLARSIIGDSNFNEVYIATPIETCESRDPKGLYRQARSGSLSQFTGVSDPYEAPIDPTLKIDTSLSTENEAIFLLIELFS